jgi:hypothetical protein
MTFFGITALGPQNTFEHVEFDHTLIHIFDYPQDFKDAWLKFFSKSAEPTSVSKKGQKKPLTTGRIESRASISDILDIAKLLYKGKSWKT